MSQLAVTESEQRWQEAIALVNKGFYNMYLAGKTLAALQEELPRGSFVKELEKRLSGSISVGTAYNLMAIATSFPELTADDFQGMHQGGFIALTDVDEQVRTAATPRVLNAAKALAEAGKKLPIADVEAIIEAEQNRLLDGEHTYEDVRTRFQALSNERVTVELEKAHGGGARYAIAVGGLGHQSFTRSVSGLEAAVHQLPEIERIVGKSSVLVEFVEPVVESIPVEVASQFTEATEAVLQYAAYRPSAPVLDRAENAIAAFTSNKSCQHGTPIEVIECLLALGEGAIDLDPCSNSHEMPNIPARVLYTVDDDGLKQAWGGKVFANPPYSVPLLDEDGCPVYALNDDKSIKCDKRGEPVIKMRPVMQEWVDKVVKECVSGRVAWAVYLTKNDTSTEWYQTLWANAQAICLPDHRLKHIDLDGDGEAGSSPFSSALIYFGPDVDAFEAVFSRLGTVVTRWSNQKTWADLIG